MNEQEQALLLEVVKVTTERLLDFMEKIESTLEGVEHSLESISQALWETARPDLIR